MPKLQFRMLTLIAGLLSAVIVPLTSTAALAAGRVMWKYNIFRGSVPVEELTALAERGEVSPTLDRLMKRSGQDPKEVQEILSREVAINQVTLDRFLNSPLGDVALRQLNEYIHTPSRTADTQAMRAALILSASDDDRISLIEVMQNYPTGAVVVEGDRIAEAAELLATIQGGVQNLLEGIRLF
jgi:hypothetical protein